MSMTDSLHISLAHSYQLERELGRGGMATVYLAHDLKHDRRCGGEGTAPRVGCDIRPRCSHVPCDHRKVD
jgi:hypothetical protein